MRHTNPNTTHITGARYSANQNSLESIGLIGGAWTSGYSLYDSNLKVEVSSPVTSYHHLSWISFLPFIFLVK